MKTWMILCLAASSACAGRALRTSDPADDPMPPPVHPVPSASASVADPRDAAPSDAADSIDAHHAPPATTSSTPVDAGTPLE